jgi:GH15 family glucan-1,4-alpha-glucosidase
MPAASKKPPAASVPVRPIAGHAAIGDMSTIALVALDGTVDFMCWSGFDSPSIFAGLLDPEQGGVFELAPAMEGARTIQMYVPDTNVLVTQWLCAAASVEVLDLMPAPDREGVCPTRLIRRVRVARGSATFHLRCAPRFDYARTQPQVRLAKGCAVFSGAGLKLRLSGPAKFVRGEGEVTATLRLEAGQSAGFVLDESDQALLSPGEIGAVIQYTIERWQQWAAQSTYKGRWREEVIRSALVLKLLTSRPHGSIAAAATFGLPETAGGSRNWDYRATWIRDASFTVYALMRLGYQKEATAFYRWIGDRAGKSDESGHLRVMYALDGSAVAAESELPQLDGYGGARPVRVGNDAAGQLQLDIYGELLDSIYLSNKYGEAISHHDWMGVCRVVEYVCENWSKPDAGIWEQRNEPQHHLHSRLMCWVAVDRAIRLARKRSLAAPYTRWLEVRNDIHNDIWDNFWNEELGHFVRRKGGTELDAALLMMPLVRFISATDPKWLATLDAIGRELSDEGLVYRYSHDDGLDGKEGTFAACSFWYVECLARAGRIAEARLLFEKVLHFANHVNLYSEQFDSHARLTGNFPQAFTHLALISAAHYLDRRLSGPNHGEWQA